MPRHAGAGGPPLPVHLLHVFPSFEMGGSQMRTIVLLNRLGTGFRHTIMAMKPEFGAASRIHPAVASKHIPAPPQRPLPAYVFTLRRRLRELAPDLVLTYNWGAIETVMAAALPPAMPVVHTEDGFGPDEARRLLPRRVWTRRAVLPRARRMVVPSGVLLRIALEQYRLPRRLVEFVPNGVDTEAFRPARNAQTRSELGAGPETVVFGYVGRLAPEKNLPLLLRAFAAARLPDARLALVGEGECEPELRRLAAQLGLGTAVIFTGRRPSPAAYYQAFDVFTLSSHTEQAPFSVLEAMACGLPVLSTDVGDVREMTGDPGPSAIAPPGNLESYAAALGRLSASPDLRARLGAANRQRCLTLYSVDTMVERYRRIFLDAIQGTHAH